MLEKLQALEEKYEELTRQMSDPQVLGDPVRYRKLAKAHSDLEEIVAKFREYRQVLSALEEAYLLQEEPQEEEFAELLREEIDGLKEAKENLENELQILLLPKDPRLMERDHGDPQRNRRGRGGPVCRGPLPHVRPLRRGEALESGGFKQQPH